MLFSPPTQYAILGLCFLAAKNAEKPVTVAEIAGETGMPAKFLAKILIQLKNHRLLRAVRGPGGGYLLNRAPDEIRLADIVRAVEPTAGLGSECVLGLDVCLDERPCPLHVEWKRFKSEVNEKIHQLNLRELSDKLVEKRAHLGR